MTLPAWFPRGRVGHAATLSGLLALLVTTSHCADADHESDFQAGDCEVDGDCPRAHACNLAVGRCDLLAPSAIALDVLPPANDRGWVRQEFLNPSPGDEGRVVLRLERGAELAGRVHPSDEPLGRLPAQIIATRLSRLDGRPAIRFETSSVAGNGDGGKPSYSLWLNAGYAYSFQVIPNAPNDLTVPCEGDSCPPSYPMSIVRDVFVSQSSERNFVLEAESESFEVKGRVLDAAGQPFDFSVQVRAVDSYGYQSTIGVSCSSRQPDHCSCDEASCYGEFRIRLSGSPRTYSLRIDPSRSQDGDGAGPSPSFLIPSTECSGLQVAESLQLPEAIRLVAFPRAAQFQARVVGQGASDDPVAGAQLTFATDALEMTRTPSGFDTCRVSYQRSAITNADGRATLALLPGNETNRIYRVDIETPPESSYANQRIEAYEIGPQGGTMAPIRLKPRDIVTGLVLDHHDQPIAAATIAAEEIPLDDQTPPERPLAKAVAKTGEDGSFALPVTSGVYNIAIQPPPDAGLPPFGLNARPVSGAADGVVFQAPRAALIVGQVLVPGSRPAERFSIQVYDLAPRTAQSKHFRPIARTTTITEVDGQFRTLVPFR